MKSIFPKAIYIGATTRSPIGKFGGSLKRFTAPQLATLTLKECITRAVSNKNVDFVLMGHARQAGAGPNTARQATIFSGLPETVPSITVNQACASGLAAVILAAEKIAFEQAKSIYAGGVESMSNTPYFLLDARFGNKMGHSKITDGMYHDGFRCPMADMVMGETVEKFIAKELGISRKDQDAYALLSQERAENAWKNQEFFPETFEIKGDETKPCLREDEHRRGNTTMESLAKLAPVFDPKTGTITAGNSSGITDGAAFLNVSDEKSEFAEAEIIDYQTVALDPKRMGLGPVPAMQALLKRQNLKINDLEIIEINEAFAAQVIACQRQLNIPLEKLNPRGGAIAIGHPIGATGTRILVTLTKQLAGKPGALGVASLCVSGGQGVAVLIRSN